MAATYEWVIEQLDGPDTDDAEIIDVNHAVTYREALRIAEQFGFTRIGLVRDADNADRAWAYIFQLDDRLCLPSHVEDAFGRELARVPARFRQQFVKAHVR